MTTPLEKIAEEKTGNYQSLLKGGGGGGVPPIVKRPIYFHFFLLKASLILSAHPIHPFGIFQYKFSPGDKCSAPRFEDPKLKGLNRF